MTETSRNFMVGLFVVASFAVLGTLMVWFGEVPDWLARGEWTLRIVGVDELSGISEGTPVNLNGVEIGRVRRIDFRDPQSPERGVVIVCRIKQRFFVPKGGFAKVYGATFGLGSGRVDIIVQEGKSQEPLEKDGSEILFGEMRSIIGEFISREAISQFQTMVSNIADLAAAATPVMDSINRLVEQRSIADVSAPGAVDRGVTANLSTVFERFDKLITNLNTVLGDVNVQEDVKSAFHDLKNTASELRETVALWKTETRKIADNVNGGIDQTEAQLAESFAKLNGVLEKLDSASGDLAVLVREVNEGKGSVGLMMKDPRAYEAAVISLERLSAVLNDFKVISGKIKDDGYITVGQAPSGLLKAKLPVSSPTTSDDSR